MSISSGNKMSATDIQNLYTELNEVITNYGGNITTLTQPTAGEKVDNADINDLITKINTMKADTYLGTESDLYLTYTVINEGTKIVPNTTTTNLSTTILTNLQKIKCRNSANNSNTQKTHGTNSHGSQSNTTKRNSGEWITNNFSACFEACGGFSTFNHGFNTHGTHSHVNKTNTYNTHGTTIDILNSLTTKSNT